jgi:hypothetical protein
MFTPEDLPAGLNPQQPGHVPFDIGREEGFGQKRRRPPLDQRSDPRLLATTRQEDWKMRTLGPQLLTKLTAFTIREHGVHDHQINAGTVIIEKLHPGLTIPRPQHPAVHPAKDQSDESGDVIIVFDKQDNAVFRRTQP